jgi:hypothetical protein
MKRSWILFIIAAFLPVVVLSVATWNLNNKARQFLAKQNESGINNERKVKDPFAGLKPFKHLIFGKGLYAYVNLYDGVARATPGSEETVQGLTVSQKGDSVWVNNDINGNFQDERHVYVNIPKIESIIMETGGIQINTDTVKNLYVRLNASINSSGSERVFDNRIIFNRADTLSVVCNRADNHFEIGDNVPEMNKKPVIIKHLHLDHFSGGHIALNNIVTQSYQFNFADYVDLTLREKSFNSFIKK